MSNEVLKYERNSKYPIVVLDSEEVEWLFQIDKSELEKWINNGILSPATEHKGRRLFWRKDVADLLTAIGV